MLYIVLPVRNGTGKRNIFCATMNKMLVVAEVPDFDLELPDIAMSSLEVAGVGSFANSGILGKGRNGPRVGLFIFVVHHVSKAEEFRGKLFFFANGNGVCFNISH